MLGRRKLLVDPDLGELVRRRGLWRGDVALTEQRSVPLAVSGGRAAPDPGALALARTIRSTLAACRPAIHAALADHAAPYRGGADKADPAPEPVYAAVIVVDGALTLELGYRPAWEAEHTLGARIRDGRLIELNGSVLEP